jgi:hypothetical protein
LLEVGRNQKHRVARLLAMHSTIDDKKVTSLVIVMQPTDPGKFQPLYICREGIPNPHATKNKRYELFENLAEELDRPIIEIDVKPSVLFAEIELYYQHLIGILRMNRYLPPLG